MELVSVITLTYRKFDLLYNAIDSVLDQDYPQIEYIISDDSSPEFHEEEIREYVESKKGKNIKSFQILTHEKNQGTVRNVNDALKHTTGEIIIFVSADDSLLDSTVIKKIVNVYRDRNCEALCVSRALYNDRGEFVRNIPSRKEGKILTDLKDNKEQYQRFITGRFYEAFSGCTLSVKKAFIEQWGYFDENYTLWEDGPFFAQYLWEHYMECAFDIVGLRYNDGGVSSGKKHPLLLKDDEIFRRTDRIAHIDELRIKERAILKYSLLRSNNPTIARKIFAALCHPIGFIGIKAYLASLRALED